MLCSFAFGLVEHLARQRPETIAAFASRLHSLSWHVDQAHFLDKRCHQGFHRLGKVLNDVRAPRLRASAPAQHTHICGPSCGQIVV